MQMIIDIQEDIYDEIKFCKYVGDKYQNYIGQAIFSGIVLPKNHGKIIDVDEYFTSKYSDTREFLEKATPIVKEITCCSSRKEIKRKGLKK